MNKQNDEFANKQYRRVLQAKMVISQHPRTAILSRFVFIGDTIMTQDVPCAATDGYNQYYNPDFISKQKDNQVLAVVLHETLHVMFDHINTSQRMHKEDAYVTAQAVDYVVNNVIDHYVNCDVKDFVAFWTTPVPLLNKKYDDSWSVKRVFDDLKKNSDKNKQQGQSLDEHMHDANASKSEEEKAAIKQALGNALAEGIKAHKSYGKGSQWVDSLIIEEQRPKINWRGKVLEWLTAKGEGEERAEWRKPKASWLANGFYKPTRFNETLNKVTAGIDVSGSIFSAPAMSVFLSEFFGLVKSVGYQEASVLYWDTSITREETYNTANPFTLSKTKPSGGGGTDPECVRQRLTGKDIPDILIMFTDGEVPSWGQGKWPCPVLWVIIDNPTATPTCGKTIHINLKGEQ